MAILASNNLPPDLSQQTMNAVPGKSQSVPMGSVFLNNTTYAGCDIKVLINLYDGGQQAAEQISTLQKDIDDAQKEYTRILTDYNGINLRVSEDVHQATQQFNLRTNILEKGQGDLDDLEDLIKTLQEQMAGLQKAAPAVSSKVLAECQTLSLSVFRDKRAVRACGTTYPKAFTRGPREIAGSLIFTVFDQHVVWDLLQAHPSDFDGNTATGAILDQLPPVDIIVVFANEYGSMSRMTIYGAEFVSEGQTMSIEDLLTENAVNFVARDYDPMRKIGSRVKADGSSASLQRDFVGGQKASSLLNEDDYQKFQKDSPYDRFLQRRNPFI